MKLDLVIPTKGRIEKLDNCINSILHSIRDQDVSIYIYFSIKEEYNYYQSIFKDTGLPVYNILMNEDYKVPRFWNKHLKYMEADALCYLNDDVLLLEDTISTLFDMYQSRFPDFEGVMGLNQVNVLSSSKVEAAFGVIGKKYADSFPDRKVWCPDYYRFYADFELWRFAKKTNRFEFASPVQIHHLHPCTDRKLADETHADVRTWIDTDRETFRIRSTKNLLWGDSWELIH